MMTPHEENEYNIKLNKREIAFNRGLTIIVALLIIALVGVTTLKMEHSLHECENRLFLKLMERSNSPLE